MTDQDDENLTEEAKQLYRKTKLPHKFCPYCGTRNEAGAESHISNRPDRGAPFRVRVGDIAGDQGEERGAVTRIRGAYGSRALRFTRDAVQGVSIFRHIGTPPAQIAAGEVGAAA